MSDEFKALPPLLHSNSLQDGAAFAAQLAEVDARRALIKKKRPRTLTEEQKCDVLMLYHSFQAEDLRDRAKHPDRKKKPGNFQGRVASLLQYSKDTVGNVYAAWRRGESVTAARPPANRRAKRTRIPRTKGVLIGVRNFVRDQRARKQRVVARHVWDMMRQCGVLDVDEKDARDCASSQRAVRRYLEVHGFRRGDKSTAEIGEKSSVLEARSRYLQRLVDNAALPFDQQLRFVDLDESYIHHHYRRHHDSLFDPNDESATEPRGKHKGQRYCFVAGIQGRNPRKRQTDQQDASDRASLIRDSVHIFKSSSSSGDYHKNFNGKNFCQWFKEKLLPNLKHPSLIRMDNAAYHHTKPENAPKRGKMKKAELMALLTTLNIAFGPKDLMPTLNLKLKEYLATIEEDVVSSARAAGHEVVFTPPYHCDLQPIELVWSQVKGDVGRQYDIDTTMATVLTRLNAAFDRIAAEPDRIARLYMHVAAIERAYLQQDDEEGDPPATAVDDEDLPLVAPSWGRSITDLDFGSGSDSDDPEYCFSDAVDSDADSDEYSSGSANESD